MDELHLLPQDISVPHDAPVNLDEDVQAWLEILESHHHLVSARHNKGEVKHDSVHGDAFVDEDRLDPGFVQELHVGFWVGLGK